MTERITLSVDRQKRMSVGKLGLEEGHVVAEPLPDGSGWVVRPAKVLTEAELDIMSRPGNLADIQRGIEDLREGRLTERIRRDT